MEAPHLAKRRRLNEAIHKPFRSPLKTTASNTASAIRTSTSLRTSDIPQSGSPDHVQPGDDHTNAGEQAEANVKRPHEQISVREEIPDSEDDASPIATSPPTKRLEHDLLSPASTTLPASTTPTSQSSASHPQPHQPTTKADVPTAPDTAATRTTTMEKQRQIKTLQQQIDTLSSAPLLSAPNAAQRLPELIAQWTRVARAAAEEIFPGVRERFAAQTSRGGGEGRDRPSGAAAAAASRRADDLAEEAEERLRTRAEMLRGGSGQGGDELGTVERRVMLEQVEEERAALKLRVEGREEGGQGEGNDGHDDDRDDTAFTMGTMLRGMNIELELLGWNEQDQDWDDVP